MSAEEEKIATVEDTATTAKQSGRDCPTAKKQNKFLAAADNFFGIGASGSSFKTEIIAGITTFMAMVYALLVVPGMYGLPDGSFPYVSFNAVYIATAIGSIIGTMLMAFLAKMPLAQASGLGATAYITGTLLAKAEGFTYANAMIFVMVDGLIFVLLTATGLRKKILAAIPEEVKISIPVGIGMYIALIGFSNSSLVQFREGAIGFASFNVLSGNLSYLSAVATALTLFGVIATGILAAKKVKGGMLWGMLGTAAAYYAFAGLGCIWQDSQCIQTFKSISFDSPFAAFADWCRQSVGQVFVNGFDFSGYLNNNNVGALIILIITSALSLCMIDMFDTLGTLYGACSKGGLIDGDGYPLRMNKCMLSDAVATCVGSVCGCSTVTTYVEASSGVAAGGRTGFSAFVTAVCFMLAMFLSPIAKIIPVCSTSAVLIWVGVLMMSSVRNIDWTNPVKALPAFLTVTVMAFGFSISIGIGVGIISCVVINAFTGNVKKISPVTWVIATLFLVMFLLTN